jgi:endoribonuclease LACTB2
VKLESIHVYHVSPHVVQLRIPTPTLPPSFETNSYIIHDGAQAVWVDAGTTDTVLLNQGLDVLNGLGQPRLLALIATHYHRDHTHGMPYMQERTRAPIFIHRDDEKAMRAELAPISTLPLEIAAIPSTFTVGKLAVHVHHAPGHTRGHIHVHIPADSVILVGDHLAGDGSVWIGPPDGNMELYYRALDSIASGDCEIAGPGHGPTLTDARAAAVALKERRLNREQQICQLLEKQPLTVDDIVNAIYVGNVPESAEWVARRTVLAHLERLMGLHRVASDVTSGKWRCV